MGADNPFSGINRPSNGRCPKCNRVLGTGRAEIIYVDAFTLTWNSDGSIAGYSNTPAISSILCTNCGYVYVEETDGTLEIKWLRT